MTDHDQTCPECGGKTITQYRWIGGQGDVPVRSCLTPGCYWGELVTLDCVAYLEAATPGPVRG